MIINTCYSYFCNFCQLLHFSHFFLPFVPFLACMNSYKPKKVVAGSPMQSVRAQPSCPPYTYPGLVYVLWGDFVHTRTWLTTTPRRPTIIRLQVTSQRSALRSSSAR